MNENEFVKALLRGEEQVDLRTLTERVVRRDRRRIWLLAIICVIAWMTVVMFPWATILPMLAKVAEHQSELNQSANPTSAERLQNRDVLDAVRFGAIAAFISSMVCMFAAALCTVLLIVLSRRATLRQINARLREISSQMKKMGGGV